MFSGEDMEGTFYDALVQSKIPPPTDWDRKDFEYLSDLADDSEMSGGDRAKAGILFGIWSTVMNSHGIFLYFAMKQGLDAAMLKYHQHAPKRDWSRADDQDI